MSITKSCLLPLVVFLICCSGSTSAQWIYSQGFAAISGAPELQRINVADQSFVRLAGMGDMGDIAFHPDQRLLGVVFDKVYVIDTVTSAYTEIYDIGDFQSVGMTIDFRGIMYFSGYNPNTNRNGIAIFNPATSQTRIVADFGPINQGFINDLEFYNGQLYVVGELPSSFPEPAALFRVDTSGLNQHDTITEYQTWPGRALAAVNDSCGSQYLVSPVTGMINYFYPPLDSVRHVSMSPPGGIFYSSGATSRTSYLGSVPPLQIASIDLHQDPCTGSSNAMVVVNMQQNRPSGIQFAMDGGAYQSSNIFHNVVPGEYQIDVRDGWGCNITRTINILDVPAFPVVVKVNPAICGENNGRIIIESLESGLQYALDNFIFGEDSLFTGLSGGTHVLVIRNDAGCSDTMSISIESFFAPTFISLISDEQCNAHNGIIELSNTIGEGILDYSIDSITWQNISLFQSLASGNYTVYVRDEFNCISTEDVIVKETGQPVITDILVQDEQCGEDNGSISLTANSDHGPLTFSIDGISFGSTSLFTDMNSGSYSVSVRDTFGCTTVQTVNVNSIGGPLFDEILVSPEYCDKSNGSILLSGTSDQLPLSYSLNGGVFSLTNEFTGLTGGTYNVAMQDASGCLITSDVTIELIQGVPIQSTEHTDATCGFDNGAIKIISDDAGVTGYSLDREMYQTVPIFENLEAGLYTVYLLSHNICIDSIDVLLKNFAGPVIDELIVEQPTCLRGQVMVQLSAHGSGEIEFILNESAFNTTGLFSDVNIGHHTVVIKDSLGCMIDTSFTIQNPECSLLIPNVFSPNGDNQNDLFFIVSEDPTLQLVEIEIFNRWGNLVYSCKDSLNCIWNGNINGQPALDGVYVYTLTYRKDNSIQHMFGQVTVLK